MQLCSGAEQLSHRNTQMTVFCSLFDLGVHLWLCLQHFLDFVQQQLCMCQKDFEATYFKLFVAYNNCMLKKILVS